MATSTKAFFAGIGTTFVILAAGFGGGLIMANSALKEPGGYQTRTANSDALATVRVILPNSAEAAQPPQQSAASPEQVAQPAALPVQQAQASTEEPDTAKLETEQRERDRRSAERKARRQAEARARQQREQRLAREQVNAPVLAFGGDNSPRSGGGFFGN
jgi:type IV secretory pathway VirB10-like protein